MDTILNSSRNQKIVGWSVLVVALFISTFGLGVLLFLIGFICTVILAVYMAIDSHLKQLEPSKYQKLLLEPNQRFNFMAGYKPGKFVTNKYNSIYSDSNGSSNYGRRYNDIFRSVFSGDQVVDEEISSIFKLFFRDYIYSWYAYMSPNEEFPKEVRSLMTTPVQIICKR